MSGVLYGLGVGPGDPELITLKALGIVRRVPVLAYPAPETGDSFARAIVAPHLPGGQTEIAIRIPMLADAEPAWEIYRPGAAEIAGHLKAGRDVAVLCEGDPFFYGSFMYLFALLAERFAVTVVPGVSSLAACAAAAQLPLVSRNEILTVLPGPLDEADLEARLRATQAAAILKVGRHLPKIAAVLDRLGLMGQAVYVERASLGEQRILPLSAALARPGRAPYFSMVLIGGGRT